MTILSVVDLTTYAPDLSLDSAQTAIYKAQVLAEGPAGANRPLSKQQFTETPRAAKDGIIRLSRWPIDGDSPIVVQVRGNSSQYSTGSSLDWQVIEEGAYTVDLDLCEIVIPQFAGLSSSQFSLTPSSGYGARNASRYGLPGNTRRTRQHTPFHIKVTYTAGFDFQADPLDPVAESLKVALTDIVRLQSSPLASGIKQYNITDFVSATAGADVAALTTSSSGKTLVEDYLDIFKRYCPKEYAF